MAPYQVDHLLKQFNLIIGMPQTTTNSDALPLVGLQRIPDDLVHVVTSVKPK